MSRLVPFKLGDTYGGVNKKIAPHLIPNNAATVTDNMVLRSFGIEKILGWSKFGATSSVFRNGLQTQRLTDGAASPANSTILNIDEFFKNDGSNRLVALTNKRAYFFRESNDLWVPITPGAKASTTVNTDSGVGTSNLFVASTSGYARGDTIMINEGGPRLEENQVLEVLAGPPLL